jgi:hypothetical protein
MRMVLDLLEDFIEVMGYQYERLDGCITGIARQSAIDRYCAPNSEKFIFLITTRSGNIEFEKHEKIFSFIVLLYYHMLFNICSILFFIFFCLCL